MTFDSLGSDVFIRIREQISLADAISKIRAENMKEDYILMKVSKFQGKILMESL